MTWVGYPGATGTCRPGVLPRVGVALRVVLLDSFRLLPARSFPELRAMVWPRVSAAGAWTCLGPAAPACSCRRGAAIQVCQPYGSNHRESESFAASRSLQLRTCYVARDPDQRSPSLLPPVTLPWHFMPGWLSWR